MFKKILSLFLFTCFYSITTCFSQGNGSSGSLNATSGTTTIDNLAIAVTSTIASGSTTITVSSTAGFVAGDVVLIMQMQGTGAGSYNELTIVSTTGTSMTFSSPTSATYTNTGLNLAQIIKIPQYTTVNVAAGATLTAPAWNGSTGGVLIYYANGAVTLNGTVTMSGEGFTGGTAGSGSAAAGTAGSNGTGGSAGVLFSTNGKNGTDANPAGGAAGGGGATAIGAVGGNGGTGGIGGIAATINSGNPGNGGASAGAAGIGTAPATAGTNMSSGMTSLLMGGGGGGGQGGQGGQSGGGGGGGGGTSILGLTSGGNGTPGVAGTASTGVGGDGGVGGGIILMRVSSISGNGNIVSNGSVGSAATGTGGAGGAGGTGGAGGNALVAADGGGGGGGGVGGIGGQGPGGGGGGGAGVIVITTGNLSLWTGSMLNIAGTGGTGGAAGSDGVSGSGGAAGTTTLLGGNGSPGTAGATPAPSTTGPSGTINATAQLPIILPIELLSFEGTLVNDSKINLTWQTSSEENNAYFIIYKSTDGINFKELGKVTGAGTSKEVINYTLSDASPNQGINYYKLTQVDIDGKQSSYKIISVNYELNSTKLVTYPNPLGDDKMLYLTNDQINFIPDETVEIEILNALGEQVYFEKKSAYDSYQFTINMNSFNSGIYYLNLTTASQKYNSEKIIIR